MKKYFTLTSLFFLFLVGTVAAQQIMISEFHYDDNPLSSTDNNERIELLAPVGFNYKNWKIQLYDGATGVAYNTTTLSTVDALFPSTGAVNINGGLYSVVVFNISPIQDGNALNNQPDGIALIDPLNVAKEFISYEGSFTAVGGFAAGKTSVNVGVFETAIFINTNGSIQRSRDGNNGPGWWTVSPISNSFGSVNASFVLPISCKSFGAFLKNDAVAVNWTASCTSTSASYEVQRSINGLDYNTIHTTKPVAVGEFDYSYTDAAPVKGNAMYRLKMVDIDGKPSYSNISRVKWGSKGLTLNNVYPTTAITFIKLQISSDKNLKAEAQVYDNVGKLVKRQQLALQEGNINYDVDVTTLARGGYTIVVQAGEEKLTARFVKQ